MRTGPRRERRAGRLIATLTSHWQRPTMRLGLTAVLTCAVLVVVALVYARGPSDDVVTLVKGIQHRCGLLADLEATFRFERVASSDLLERDRERYASGGQDERAGMLRPYHASVIRYATLGHMYKGEVRDLTRSGHVWWTEEPQIWLRIPMAHQVYVIVLFDGEKSIRYDANANVVWQGSSVPPRDKALVDTWFRNTVEIVNAPTLHRLQSGKGADADARKHQDGTYEIRASLGDEPTEGRSSLRWDIRMRVAPNLGYAVTEYLRVLERDSKPLRATLTEASDFRRLAERIHVPSMVDKHEYRYGDEGSAEWTQSTRYRMTSIRLLTDADTDLFRFKPPVGARLYHHRDLDSRLTVGMEVRPPYQPRDMGRLTAADAPDTSRLSLSND